MKSFLPLAVLVLAGVLLSININKPFVGQHDWNGVVYGQEAKNFARFGYLPLKFGATLAIADTLPEERKFSTHYTPVLPILISFSYRLFGVAEWSTRLIPIAASLVSVGLVMLLGRELISFKAGIMAGVLMAVTPMFIYYGKNPVHEVVLLPFALLGFYSYWRWRQSWQSKWWVILLVSLAAAMLIGWPGYYAAGLIAIYGFLIEKHSRNLFQNDYFTTNVRSDVGSKLKNRKFSFIFSLLFCSDRTSPVKSIINKSIVGFETTLMSKFLLLPILMIGLFSVFLIHQSILSPAAGDDFAKIAAARIGGGGFSVIEFILKELRYGINLFTVTILGLSVIWSINFCIKVAKRDLETKQLFLGLIGLFGILHVLIFPQAGWYHEYLLFPFLPFAVLAAAGAIEDLLRVFSDFRVRALIVGLVLAMAARERLSYLQALLKSEYVRDVYEEAVEFAKEQRWENEKIPQERDVYFIFYADRENI